jgi:hypothetical protein
MDCDALTSSFSSDPASGYLLSVAISLMRVSVPLPSPSFSLHNLTLSQTLHVPPTGQNMYATGGKSSLACTASSGGFELPGITQFREFLFKQLVGLSCILYEDFYAYLF